MASPSYSVKLLIGATTIELVMGAEEKEKLVFGVFNQPADHVMEVADATAVEQIVMFRAGAVGAVLVRPIPRSGEER